MKKKKNYNIYSYKQRERFSAFIPGMQFSGSTCNIENPADNHMTVNADTTENAYDDYIENFQPMKTNI